LKKEVFDLMKKESAGVGILFVIFIVLFKLVFFKEDLAVVFRTVLSLFWLFIIPGYIIMLYWREKLGFVERLIIGTALSAALIGISSYYIGLIGLNIKFHMVILPIALIFIGLFVNLRK